MTLFAENRRDQKESIFRDWQDGEAVAVREAAPMQVVEGVGIEFHSAVRAGPGCGHPASHARGMGRGAAVDSILARPRALRPKTAHGRLRVAAKRRRAKDARLGRAARPDSRLDRRPGAHARI